MRTPPKRSFATQSAAALIPHATARRASMVMRGRRPSRVGRDSVLVRHLEDLLPRVLAHEVRVVGGDVRLDVLDQGVVGLALDVHSTRAMDNLHVGLLHRWASESTRLR